MKKCVDRRLEVKKKANIFKRESKKEQKRVKMLNENEKLKGKVFRI